MGYSHRSHTGILMIFLILFSCQEESLKAIDDTDFEPIEWQKGLVPLQSDETDYRAIIHLHSHYSHDACDGNPQPNGIPDEECLADLREALCTVLIDVAFLSDHPTHSTEVMSFEDLFLIREGDTPIYDGDILISNQINCGSGHTVLVLPGVESDAMMPLGLTQHINGDYNGSQESLDAIDAQGAVSWIAHTEEREVDVLLSMELHGLELYQLHANLDPDIRAEYLGLDPVGFLNDVQPFFFPLEDEEDPPHPDLAPLGFLLPNEPSIEKWEAVGQIQRIGISGGTDAHQNVFPIDASDGERIDSYRRMMRWFNTRIQIEGEPTPQKVIEGLKEGRTWIAFETFGTPKGFDLKANSEGIEYPIGAALNLSSDSILVATLPTLHPESPQGIEEPSIEGRLYRADTEGRALIQTWTEGDVTVQIDQPGVYRVEVWIKPLHLKPYLGANPEYSELWKPWIYSGGLFVR